MIVPSNHYSSFIIQQRIYPPVSRSGGSRPLRGVRLSIVSQNETMKVVSGGGERDRTDDLMLAKHALSQLSYAPG